jgi:hypothetical protein
LDADIREGRIEGEKAMALAEAERQKAALLLYVDYVNSRHQEVLRSLEEAQDKER